MASPASGQNRRQYNNIPGAVQGGGENSSPARLFFSKRLRLAAMSFVPAKDVPAPMRGRKPNHGSAKTSSYFSNPTGKRRSNLAPQRTARRQRTGRKNSLEFTVREGSSAHADSEDQASDDGDSWGRDSGEKEDLCAMAVFSDGRSLGAASFVDESNELSVRWAPCPTPEVMRRQLGLFAEAIPPAFILVSSSATGLLIDECQRLFPEDHPRSVLSEGACVPIGACQTFTSGRGNGLLEELCRSNANSAIANSALCAVGGLLTFLLQNQVILPPATVPAGASGSGVLSSSNGSSHPIIRLRVLNLANSVLIDKLSLDALGVFSRDRHPNVHGTQTHKEGFSLANLMCSFSRQQGSKKLLRSWLRRPTNDQAVLHYRYNTIEMFLNRTANSDLVTSMVAEIKNMKSVKSSVARLESLAASSIALHEIHDWKRVYDFAVTAKTLRGLAQKVLETSHGGVDQTTVNTAFDRVARIPMTIDEIEFHISSTIDFKISRDLVPPRAFPRRGLDADLDAWRKIDDGLGSFLEKVAQDAATYDCGPSGIIPNQFGCEIRVEYRPQVGYTMLICGAKAEDLDQIKAYAQSINMNFVFMQHMDGLDYDGDCVAASIDDAVAGNGAIQNPSWNHQQGEEDRFILHFKTARMTEMDTTIGDVTVQITDAEARILLQLRKSILDRSEALMMALNAIFEFDALASMAELANRNNYVRPTLCGGRHSDINSCVENEDESEFVLDMVDARHPLQEFTVEPFIPNTLKMTKQGPIIIVTGPNGSGKSVLLRQVGLLTVMAKAGSFVPAQSFKVPNVDQIFTRITNQETAVSEESAFTIDLHQVHAALNNCTPQSLVLLDEFGKGTVAVDGVALLAATIRAFNSIGPKVILTTHAWELFEHNLLATCMRVRTYMMKVEAEKESSNARHSPGAYDTSSSSTDGRQSTSEDQHKDRAKEVPDYTRHVVPLFRLVPGLASSSMTLACAAQNGFQPAVLHRAKHIIDNLRSARSLQAISNVTDFAPAWAHKHKRNSDARKRLLEFLVTKIPNTVLSENDVTWSSDDVGKLFECLAQLQNDSKGEPGNDEN